MEPDTNFCGAVPSRAETECGYYNYATVGKALGVKLYKDFRSDEDWELINGDDVRYYDSEGNSYNSRGCFEKIEELECLLEEGRKAGMDISKMKKEVDFLTNHGECLPVCDYYEISREAARILMQESEELVFYNRKKNTYLWGICFCGISWKMVSTSVPVRQKMKEVA